MFNKQEWKPSGEDELPQVIDNVNTHTGMLLDKIAAWYMSTFCSPNSSIKVSKRFKRRTHNK